MRRLADIDGFARLLMPKLAPGRIAGISAGVAQIMKPESHHVFVVASMHPATPRLRGGHQMPRWSSPVFVLSIVLLLAPAVAFCGTVNLGLISFDQLIPGDINSPGVNVFNIYNFTGDPTSGGFALPPDFPVTDSLIFLSSSLTLMNGGSPLVILLGDLMPGALSPTDPVQFPDTSLFTEAIFSATLSQTSFLLSGGGAFLARSPIITAEVLPASGPSLVAGTDFAVITVSDVPEPRTTLLLGTVLVLLVAINRKKNHA
jgi:hypothetical protein